MAKGYKRHAEKIRAAARRELDKLIRAQDNKCHWCASEIIRARSIPPANIIKLTQCKITFTDGLLVKMIKVATVDHVRAIRDGGGNKNNIVAACYECNEARNRERLRYRKAA